MGIERPIPCHGVYPPNSNPKVCGVRDARQGGNNAIDNYMNYLSMRIQEEDAEIEVNRILDLDYAERREAGIREEVPGREGGSSR